MVMLVDSIKKIIPKAARITFRCWLGLLFFATNHLLAAECTVLQLQKAHRSGVTISNNHCKSDTSLSLKSLIEIQSGTRLWLETTSADQNADNFQIICQNQSIIPAKIELASNSQPWIAPVNFSNCSRWTSNRLTCNATGQTDTALLCVIAKKPGNKADNETLLKTSLVMRKVNVKTGKKIDEERKWTDLIKPSIDACRKLFNTQRTITIDWHINASGFISAKSLTKPLVLPRDKQFADCAVEAIENTNLPKVLQDITLTSTL